MRRGSIIGPLILIAIGVLFLLRNVIPDIPVFDLLSRYWPFLLIAWGIIRLIEIFVWAVQSKPLPRGGISGGEWALIILLCLIFGAIHTGRQFAGRFPTMRGWHGLVMEMGEQYQYPLAAVEKPCPDNCRVIVEGFRGTARISGASDGMVAATGRQTVRSFSHSDADQVSKQTPLELIQQGSAIIVRTNQDRAPSTARVSLDIDISVPSGRTTIEGHGPFGDLNIQNIGGSVELQGRGQDLQLENISGPVSIEGVYSGQIQLRNLSQTLRYQDPRITLRSEKLPGEARIGTGEFTANGINGPIVLNGRSRDVRMSGFTQSLDLTLDRGDIELKPGKIVPNMKVHTRSGDIELALPSGATFDLNASTSRGEVNNEYGEVLRVSSSGRGAAISGTAGTGPQLRLSTDRGSVTIRKSTSEDTSFPDIPGLPTSPNQSLRVEKQ